MVRLGIGRECGALTWRAIDVQTAAICTMRWRSGSPGPAPPVKTARRAINALATLHPAKAGAAAAAGRRELGQFCCLSTWSTGEKTTRATSGRSLAQLRWVAKLDELCPSRIVVVDLQVELNL